MSWRELRQENGCVKQNTRLPQRQTEPTAKTALNHHNMDWVSAVRRGAGCPTKNARFVHMVWGTSPYRTDGRRLGYLHEGFSNGPHQRSGFHRRPCGCPVFFHGGQSHRVDLVQKAMATLPTQREAVTVVSSKLRSDGGHPDRHRSNELR